MNLRQPDIQIAANPEELARAAAEEYVRRAEEAVKAQGIFTVVLAGGSTPKALYRLLAGEEEPSFRARLPWHKIHFFWGDERHVPLDHPDSNYRMACEALLSSVPVPSENVHRVRTENPDAWQAAKEYEEEICKFFFPSGRTAGQLPRFDLVLLGMGADGHTASLFPGTEALHEQARLVVSQWIERFRAYRITMTAPLLNNAARIIFLVSGEEKAETLREVLQGEYRPERFPAQLIRPAHGSLLWLVDSAAARLLHLQ
ncbi:MAG: 6-phosphogluconolactonase [Candidatus Tectomicrobia bacterium]|uniref:6-phosphogluconolactonase n=1 Tax=Tectimicrobiota bacterium TaxID=2528274 RepID=A0A932M078_UNCTE|nr:6-phosphogluconolactonase [Candidatus Tectomicrobia bacterium]